MIDNVHSAFARIPDCDIIDYKRIVLNSASLAPCDDRDIHRRFLTQDLSDNLV